MVRTVVVVVLLTLAASMPGRLAAQESVEDDAARSLFRLGEVSYFEGRFEESLRYFQQAYDLSHRAQLLFNIGQAADRAGDPRRAIEAFESYLAQVETGPNRPFVMSRLEVLRRTIAAEDAARVAPEAARASVVPDVPSPPTGADDTSDAVARSDDDGASPSRGRRIAGWASAGVGVAALALGATLLPIGLRNYAEVEDVDDGTSWSEIRDAYDRSSPRIVSGAVLLGVGAAATAFGLTFALRAPDDDAPPIELQATGTGVTIRGRF